MIVLLFLLDYVYCRLHLTTAPYSVVAIKSCPSLLQDRDVIAPQPTGPTPTILPSLEI